MPYEPCIVHLGPVAMDEVFPFLAPVRSKAERRDFAVEGKTYSVKMNSLRYMLFRANRFCVKCGLEGTILMLDMQTSKAIRKAEQRGQRPLTHFNLYALVDGELVLMTKDHILPVSKGGTDVMTNLQTMCYPCNHEKADAYDQILLQSDNR